MKGDGRLEHLWKNDLPEIFDPMTAKELRQSLRRVSFVLLFLTVQLLAVVAIAAEFRQGNISSGSSEYVGFLNPWLIWSSGPFWRVTGLVCMILMPMGGVVLMRQEIDEGNHELLLLTQLNRWRVVLGKFISLWGMCAITLISLMPYVMVRFFLGGIEWWGEISCAATVLGFSAIIGAGAIGCSAFRGIGIRIGVFLLFLGSMAVSCSIPLSVVAFATHGCGILYHLTALSAVVCYTMIGLVMARSRLRLVVMVYEVNPTGMAIALLVFAPFGIGMVTAVTLGYGGFVGLLAVAYIANRMDVLPKTRFSKKPIKAGPPPLN